MKKLTLTFIAAVSTLAATVPVANAATANATFAVSATLTSYCTISSFSAGGVAFGAVQAFTAPSNATATSTVKCTRGLAAPTMAFDAAPTGGGTGSSSATSATPTGAGVLPNGLYYTLGAALGTVTSGVAPTTAGLNAQDSDDRVLTVTGAMGAQAGANTGATSHVRTMTITF